jgi:2-dehydropantoate 2-reductase
MARIAIIGPGAIGGAIALWLEQTGRHHVTLCARRPLDTISMDTPAGRLASQPKVLTEPPAATPVDCVMIATKAYQAAASAVWLPALVNAGTTVAILQNGVEHRERFEPYGPVDQILPVMVGISAERRAPNHILQRGAARLVVPDEARGRAFAALFAGTPVEVTPTADFKSAVWRKLCGNSAGAINALLLQPTRIMHDEKIGDLARAIVRECIAVGRAEGAQLDDSVADAVLQGMRNAPPDSINSMHADRMEGRPMEIDARNGVIVRLGRKHGIPTPCNEMAVALLAAFEQQQSALPL